MNTRIMLKLDLILLDSDVVETIVNMDAAIFCSKPHGGLVGCGSTIF